MIAIGIDPGTVRTGYGLVKRVGNRLHKLTSGTIRTDAKAPMEKRLLTIYENLEQILTANAPDQAAVEDVFFFKNPKSAIKLGQVRGVILLTLAKRRLKVSSYPPALVKRAVVGSGRAAKNQMQRVVQAILGLKTLPEEDEADALAVAICCLNAAKLGR
jgi:crossover junction endodeoxyribonuclease RuvC